MHTVSLDNSFLAAFFVVVVVVFIQERKEMGATPRSGSKLKREFFPRRKNNIFASP